jgi:hypothetical protein
MAVATFEGIVENSQIRLREGVKLPVRTRFYVVVPELEVMPRAHVHSPRRQWSAAQHSDSS